MGQYIISPKPLIGSEDDDTLSSFSKQSDYYYKAIFGEEGDDVISGGELDDELHGGDDDDWLMGGAGVDSFDGGEGNDTVSYEGAPPIEGSDLYLGAWVDLVFGSGGWIAYGETFSEIENLIGSDWADQFFGDSEDNIFEGRGGMDYLVGRGGDDTLIGGDHHDRLDGGEGSDTLDGGPGDDYMEGGGGDDLLEGGFGADRLYGGSGQDTASYAHATLGGISVNLASGVGLGGEAAGDRLDSIEIIVGSDSADGIYGGGNSEYFYGGGDDDVLEGGGGADTLDGGEGRDIVSYVGAPSGISVDLVSQTGTRGDADGDSLDSIEHVRGSFFDDVIDGNDEVNVLYGFDGDDVIGGDEDDDQIFGGEDDDELFGDDGDDVLAGGAGSDFLDGGSGSDRLNGGLGDDYLEGGSNADRFEFEFNWGDDEIVDFDDGSDLIGLSGPDWTQLAFSASPGDGVLITYGSNSILVHGAQLGDFSQDDFYNFVPN